MSRKKTKPDPADPAEAAVQGTIASLRRLARALSHAASVEQVAEAVLDCLAAQNAVAGWICFLAEDALHLTVAHRFDSTAHAARLSARIPLEMSHPLTDAIRQKEALFVEFPGEQNSPYPAIVSRWQAHLRSGTLAALPLIIQDRVLGGIEAVFALPLTEEERALLETIAQMSALALERTRLVVAEKQAREEAEQKLAAAHRESEDRTRDFFGNLTDGFLVCDPQWQILYANDAAVELVRLPHEALVGKSAWEVFADFVGSDYYAACYRAMEERIPLHTEDYWPRHARWFENHIFPVNVGVAVMFRDITDRRQAQEEIEALNARLRRSIAETHHRVKNNLQIMASLADLQIEEREEMVPVSALKRMGQHTRSLAAVHDLLVQAVTEDARTDHLSARAILKRLIPLLQETTGGRAIVHESDDFWLSSREGSSLTLLISELVSNAVKHGEGKISVTLRAEAERARLEVADEGAGFPAGFDPKCAASTGWSLIESTGRYDLHGDITFQNRLEGGAAVVVTFSLA